MVSNQRPPSGAPGSACKHSAMVFTQLAASEHRRKEPIPAVSGDAIAFAIWHCALQLPARLFAGAAGYRLSWGAIWSSAGSGLVGALPHPRPDKVDRDRGSVPFVMNHQSIKDPCPCPFERWKARTGRSDPYVAGAVIVPDLSSQEHLPSTVSKEENAEEVVPRFSHRTSQYQNISVVLPGGTFATSRTAPQPRRPTKKAAQRDLVLASIQPQAGEVAWVPTAMYPDGAMRQAPCPIWVDRWRPPRRVVQWREN